jgi:hypothetical protein
MVGQVLLPEHVMFMIVHLMCSELQCKHNKLNILMKIFRVRSLYHGLISR